MKLLKKICAVHAPSGEEYNLSEYILYHIVKHQKHWRVQPDILFGAGFHDNLILVFGKPKTAVFAHIDTVGYTVGYGKKLHPIGSPSAKTGTILNGTDSAGKIECVLSDNDDENGASYAFSRKIELGTSLTYKPNFKIEENFIHSPYLDNRLGVRAALQLAETLENGIIVFSTYEEHGGGGAEIAAKYIYDTYQIKQALILDVTWVTEGIRHGKGAVISLRDSGIPRKRYLDCIKKHAAKSNINHQFEVEQYGGSDGTAIQATPYPINWCFIGIPVFGVHSPDEYAKISDYEDTVKLYQYLMKHIGN